MEASLEVIVRVIALFLCVYGCRKLMDSIIAGKIAVLDGDFFDWYPYPDLHRATEPLRYWTTVALYGLGLACCMFTVVFGWRSYS